MAAVMTLFLFASCEKEVQIVPQDLEDQVVVEATIENDQPPVVFLTKTLDYFSELKLSDLTNSFIRNATVVISNGTRSVQLKEYRIGVDTASFYYYTIDSTNPAGFMIGELNKTYKLTITTGGKTYTAATKIPDVARKIDSLWWENAPNNSDTSNVIVFSKVTDPKGLGNYVRYFTSVNDSTFLPGFNSVFDDQVVDGTTYNIQVFRGQSRNTSVDRETFGYFKRGSKVKVKLANIDKATYDFWRTWEQNQSNIGNPFGVPIKIISNLSTGAIGYFGGYGSKIETIQIPK